MSHFVPLGSSTLLSALFGCVDGFRRYWITTKSRTGDNDYSAPFTPLRSRWNVFDRLSSFGSIALPQNRMPGGRKYRTGKPSGYLFRPSRSSNSLDPFLDSIYVGLTVNQERVHRTYISSAGSTSFI